MTSRAEPGTPPVGGPGEESASASQPPPPAPPEPVDDPATAFTRQDPTLWLKPGLLLRSAGAALVSGLLGEYQDKRELMGSLPADEPLDLRTGREDVWVDYVADTGDGFAATYAVASLLAQEELPLPRPDGPDVATQRGQLLVMGGDQCYPSASVQAYEDRLIGPFRAALLEVKPGQPPYLLAVPGNHDWYDGLTAFMRTFCQRRWIGGWKTNQSRSYFAVALPGRWWLWGIDIQFDTYIDDVQRQYFEGVAAQLRPGDAVILCSAKPSWVAAGEDDLEAYATLDFVDRTLVRPSGARVRVCISGDRHHYVRYEAADGGQRVTAGGGGAYLSPTHHLKSSITVPPPESKARGRTDPVEFHRRGVFPDPTMSRRLGWGVFRLPFTTPTFAALLGGVYTLLALAMVWALGPELLSLPDRLRQTAAAVEGAGPGRFATALADSLSNVGLVLLVLLAAVAFTKHSRPGWQWAIGATHGVLHLVTAVGLTWAAATLTQPLPGAWTLLALVPLVFVFGGLAGTELVALYLLIVDRWKLNSNELYAAQGIVDHKNFLRMHVGADDLLTIHAVGLRRVPRRWDVSPGPPGQDARFVPVGEGLEPALIEKVRVGPEPGVVAP